MSAFSFLSAQHLAQVVAQSYIAVLVKRQGKKRALKNSQFRGSSDIFFMTLNKLSFSLGEGGGCEFLCGTAATPHY